MNTTAISHLRLKGIWQRHCTIAHNTYKDFVRMIHNIKALTYSNNRSKEETCGGVSKILFLNLSSESASMEA